MSITSISAYLPNNAVIVVVGDFDTKILLAKIKAVFEPIPSGTPSSRRREPIQVGARRITAKKEAQLPFVFAGYRTPNYPSTDAYALVVLTNLLSTGKSSRLYRSLVYEKQLALEVGGEYTGLTIDPDLFYFYGVPRPGKSETELEKALYQEIDRTKTELVSDRELQKLKSDRSGLLLGRRLELLPGDAAWHNGKHGAGLRYFETYIDNIRTSPTKMSSGCKAIPVMTAGP
jgi:predicted Zn-dependent peptidase